MLYFLFLLIFPFLTTSSSEEKCQYIPEYKVAYVYGKQRLENVLIDVIESRAVADSGFSMRELADCFQSLGRYYSVAFVSGEGLNGADIMRFTVDRSFIWPIFLRAPGASNGKFTAIFRIVSPNEIAVIRRGGKVEWLKLD